ncbi:MAG: beta-lactamase family protein [Chloroflexia bacterium]|nr:beta-lactamase family protein [Chloroflexia bacterium]
MSDGGLSETRLARMHETMTRHVEEGWVPGLVTLVSRRGEVHTDAIGVTAIEGRDPMRRDTIFRIASVGKPIAAAAAMILVEECVLRLDDPVDELLPELANRQVLRAIDSTLDDTVPANRPITLRDLLTFRAGYGAIFTPPDQSPLAQALIDAGVAAGPNLISLAPDEFMKAYADLPLAHQPGEQWLYNTGSDMLGVLIARATGMSLGEFMQERIFSPLGMTDTAFSVPEDKRDRLPAAYWTNFETGEFGVFDSVDDSQWSQPPVFESGSGGLVSTVDDLLVFGEMMLNNGTYGNERILSRPSVALMTADHITPEQKAASAVDFFPGFWDNHGWGFGVAINTRRDTLEATPGRYGWDGGYGTSWYVDPAEELIGILMTQRVWDGTGIPQKLLADFWTSVYQAIAD